jgi:hypothetical protein
VGGAAFASAVGSSIFVTFVFAAFLCLWTLVTIWKRWRRETLGLLAAGSVMIVLSLPYLRELSSAGETASPFHLTVRAFPLASIIATPRLSEAWRLIVVNGALLPLNYFLEFGFFFLVAASKWRQIRSAGKPVSRNDLALALMLTTSLAICTFVRSNSSGMNDLGWRGMLVAEFVLVLWAVDLFPASGRPGFVSAHQRALMVAFVVLGLAGTVYDLVIARAYPILADLGKLPPLDWMSPDREFGQRTYAARSAYEWLRHATPSTAAVQSNPNVVFQDTLGMLYGDRHTVAADLKCLTAFGGDAAECRPLVAKLQEIFPPAGRQVSGGLQEVCGALPVDVLVAKDTDSAWSDRQSWVWRGKPMYGNQFVRLFPCALRTAAR